MAFYGSQSQAAQAAVQTPAERDIEVANPPGDSISSIAFAPQADFLAAGSWDNNVRIYEVGANGQTQGKAMYAHQGPVLSVGWNKDGTKVLSAGADNAGRMYDMQTGQSSQIAQHDAPIKAIKWIDSPQGGFVVTGSWDKTVKYWDLRAASPIASVTLPERCYTLDVMYPLMVVGCAERHIQIFNLTNPGVLYKSMASPLKWQTRVISCFSQGSGFAVGSVEGRVAFHYVDDKDAQNNFSFRCHRRDAAPNAKDQSLVFAVNDISFHPVHGTFSTCGADGTVHFWDGGARTRLKSMDPAIGPISATAFNRAGTIFAYAASYDWSKGHSGMTPGHPNKIMLHACKDDEVKRRPPKR